MMLGVISRLWSMSLQAGILIIVILTVRFFLKKYPKAYMYFLWMLAGIRLLCPVFVEAPFSLQPERIRPDGIVQNGRYFSEQDPYSQGDFLQNNEIQTDISGKDHIFPDESMEEKGIGSTLSYPIKDSAVNNLENAGFSGDSGKNDGITAGLLSKVLNARAYNSSILDWKIYESEMFGSIRVFGLLVIIYLAGAVAFICFYLIQYMTMRYKVSTAVRGKQNVWFSEKIDSPFVLGIVRPRIIMPYGLKKQEGYHILKHEQTHIRHHDPLIRMTGTLCICLHWWNPLVWLAVIKMNQDMEMFCDETVLREASPEEKKSYARTLLAFAEKRSGLSVGLAFGESHTEKRVRNLARKRSGGIVVTSIVMTLTVFCVAAFMTVPGIEAEGADINTNHSGTGNTGNNGIQAGNVSNNAGNNGIDDNTQNMAGTGNGYVTLTDEDKEYLMNLCPKIPEFVSAEQMDPDFWREFLFNYYTSDFERESVDRYMDPPGFEISYAKVSYDEVQDTVKQIFGDPLSVYVEDPENLTLENSIFKNNILYEEGNFYISLSDSPSYEYEYVYDTDTDVLKEVELLERLYDEEDYNNRIALYLLPADNDRGFKISGKEKLPILQDTGSGMIREHSFEVEFNPHGQVTFATYAPNTELNPGNDVAFKLIQNNQVIYTFGGNGIRQDKDIWKFQNVAAVAFPDINGDGYTDVITISNYVSDRGMITENMLSEARIYTGREGRYFIEESTLSEAYNNSHDQKTITDIENFVARPEYQDYFERTSIYGRWKVTEHIPPTGIYALSEEETESFENTQIVYGRYWYKQGSSDPCTVDNYRKEAVSVSTFEEDFKTSTEAMGLSVTEFNSFKLEGVQNADSQFGQYFYQIDTDHALIYYEGVFFRAVRE